MNKLIKYSIGPLLCGLFFCILFLSHTSSSFSETQDSPYIQPETITEKSILYAMLDGKDSVELEILDFEDARAAFWNVYAAHPEVSLKYIPKIQFRTYDANSRHAIALLLKKINGENNKYKNLERSTSEIMSELKDKTDAEKTEGVEKWIRSRCEYADRLINMWDECLYGCLVEGKATCLGFAEGYYYMMRKLHVPCKIEYNKIHAWNKVYIDGQWKKVDLTLNR